MFWFGNSALLLTLVILISSFASCTQTSLTQDKMHTQVSKVRKSGQKLAAKGKKQKSKRAESKESTVQNHVQADTSGSNQVVLEENKTESTQKDAEQFQTDSVELEKYFAEVNQQETDTTEFVLLGDR